MPIKDTEMIKFMSDVREDLGSLKQGVCNMNDYIGAVSRKADRIESKIDSHVPDTKAHGMGALIAWVGVGISLLSIAILFLRHR